MAASIFSTISNYLKPHRAEAISRIRTNSFFLVALLLVTYLLPTPFLLNFTKWNSPEFSSYIWKIGSLLAYNILQSAYAIKYPRQPFPPLSPKKRSVAATPNKGKRLAELVSSPPRTPERGTNTVPFSPSSSLRPNPYAASPLRYTLPSSSTSTFASTGSLPPTPSPVVSAYRGRMQGNSASHVRPIDGSYVELMKSVNSDEEDQ
ncbi:hypothetical protein BDZ89DRAFT_1125628 [Hymenopellis radicata]|nr:hypothetical protein BDZ89DRAFT_1125628 [Hymenopellis radicata]